MKKIIYSLAITSLLFACTNQDKSQEAESAQTITSNDTNIVKKSPEKMNEEDRITFFDNAAIGGLMEVEASSQLMAATKSNPNVIAHAQMIKNDHLKANEELKSIAERENYKLPTSLPEKKLKLLKQFEELNDEAKNEFYINLMVTEHDEAINLFNLAKSMEDPVIANFATKTLPILKHHYEMTVKLKNSLLTAKKDQGDDVLKISDKTRNEPAKNH